MGTIRSGAVFILSPASSTAASATVQAATNGCAIMRGAPLSSGSAPIAAATETVPRQADEEDLCEVHRPSPRGRGTGWRAPVATIPR
jgi:hypothetical protein